MFIYILLFLIGCTLLYFGSDYLIDNSIILSQKFKISPIVIGATVVALGTSLPELLVSFYSIIFIDNNSSASGLIVGNVLGSNIANISLVLGYCAFVYAIVFESNFLKDLVKVATSLYSHSMRDRYDDDGKLGNHHIFFMDQNTPNDNTVTELIFVPDSCEDGKYFLSLGIANFNLDAAPSSPVIYRVK